MPLLESPPHARRPDLEQILILVNYDVMPGWLALLHPSGYKIGDDVKGKWDFGIYL